MSATSARRLMGNRLFRHNLTFFAGSLLVGFFGYVYQFLAGRLLGPREYGVVASTFAIYNIFSVALLLVLTVTMRYTASLTGSRNMAGLRFLFRRLSIAAAIAGGLTGLLYLALLPSLAGFLRTPTSATVALLPSLVLALVAGVNRGTLQGQERFAWLSAVLVVEASGRATLCFILVSLGFGASGALAAVSIAAAAGYVMGLVPLRHLLVPGARAAVPMRNVLRFALPTVAAVGGITFLYNADIVLVRHFLGDQAGVYGSAATLGRIVYFATFSITGVMFPRVSAQLARGESAVRTLALSAVAMSLIAAALVAGFAVLPNVALLPFGERFHGAARYLPLFGLAMAMLSLANLLVNYLLAAGDWVFALVLGAADILEVALILRFHQSIFQVLWSVLGVLTLTVGGLVLAFARSQKVKVGRNT